MSYKLLSLIAGLIVFLLLFPVNTFGSENFRTDYSITYTLSEGITTHSRINVALTNNTTQYYASSYKIQLGFSEVSNIKVFDEGTQVSPEVLDNEKGTEVFVEFVNRVVGQGSRHNFYIEFDTSEIAQNLGNVWEVNLPGLDEESDAESFNVSLVFPKNLGSPAFIKPRIQNLKQNGNTLIFSKEDLGNQGLSIAFGEYQIYDFDLEYHLKNSNVVPEISEITLPSDTSYQEVKIDDIFPKPDNVVKDFDGNYIARFLLEPASEIDVKVKGQSKVFLNPKKSQITKEEKAKYTSSQKYWEAGDPEVIKLAGKLKTPESIYKYVSENLNYDFSRVKENQERLGAKAVLNDSSSAVCLEFTDLFIALARAAGIPAREVVGFAYTQNSKERPLSLVQDVLHAWPEYYDEGKNTWIMVDPTWGNTTNGLDYFNTLDFDHLAFAIHGVDSERPVSAGGYKIDSSKDKKDVQVKPSKNFGPAKATLDVHPQFSYSYTAGLPISSTITVRNIGNSITSENFLLVSSNSLDPEILNLKISQIPPFGHISIPVSFDSKPFLTNERANIKIQLGNRTFYHRIYIRPFFYDSRFYFGGAFLIAILGITVFIYLRRPRRLPFS